MKAKAALLVIIVLVIVQSSFCKKASVSEFPEVAIKDLQGGTQQLTQFLGKPLVINFWATWCGPCRIEIPMLNQLHKKYGGQVTIIGISTDDEGAEAVKPFMKEVPIRYKSFLKTPGLEEKFGGVWALPTTYFYDRNGRRVNQIIGVQDKETFEKTIQEILK